MSINLDLPTLDDNPVLLAEVRPNKVTEFIERLPFNNIFSAATVLLEEMQILNRQKVNPDSRTKALELYRPAIIRITNDISHYYVNNAVMPMPAKVKSCASAAELLWLELSYGYKLAWMDLKGKRLNLSSNKSIALLLQRAIHSLNQLALVYYHIYFTPPVSIWSDLHQLYFSAAEQGLDQIEVNDSLSSNNVTTINLAYMHVMLIALADPQHLAKADIQRIVNYLLNLSTLGVLCGIGSLESNSGVFLIKLDGNQPPIPLLKKVSAPDSSNDILLITLEIARKIHQHLQLLQEGKLPSDDSLPANALDADYVDLLTDLIKHLATTPKRLFSRAKKDHKVQLVFGVSEINQLIKSNATGTYKPSVWQVQNTSATGFALKKSQVSEVSIKVGDFVAMKETATSGWSIAVLRRITTNQQNQLDIGLQLLAPNVEAIGVKSDKLGQFESALLLPEISQLNQPKTIVTSNGIYTPGTVFSVLKNGTTSQVLATKLLERTASFERFLFSLL